MSLISVDGCVLEDTAVKISPLSLGMAYGYGLFETLLITRRQPVFFEAHIKRLSESAEFFNLTVPKGQLVSQWLMDLINASSIIEGRLRISLIPTDKRVGSQKMSTRLFIVAESGKPYSKKQYQKGLDVGLLSYKKNQNSIIVKHKTINYLENILGQQQAAAKGWAEGLFLNTAGFLAEGTKSNIFLLKTEPFIHRMPSAEYCPELQGLKLLLWQSSRE